MRYRVGSPLAWVCLYALLPGMAHAQTSLHVDEPAIAVRLDDSGIRVDLPVNNVAKAVIDAVVELELLDPKDNVVSRSSQNATFTPGKTKYRALLTPVRGQTQMAAKTFAWYRLRYSLSASAPGGYEVERFASGILSVSEADATVFELHVSQPIFAKPGESGTFLVRATWSNAPSRPSASAFAAMA